MHISISNVTFLVLIEIHKLLVGKCFLNFSIELLKGCYSIALNEQFISKFINNY